MLACRKRIPIWIVAACLVCCLQEIHALDHYEEDSDRFPGWKGELDMTSHTEYHDSVGYGELGQVRKTSQTFPLNLSSPPIFFKNCTLPHSCAGNMARPSGTSIMDAPCISVPQFSV